MLLCERCGKNEIIGRKRLCVHCRKKDRIKKIKNPPPKPNFKPSKTVIVDECVNTRELQKKIRDMGYACFTMRKGTPDDKIRERIKTDENYLLLTADKELHKSLQSKSILVGGQFKPEQINFLYDTIIQKL